MSLELISVHKSLQSPITNDDKELRARYERIAREWLAWVSKVWERGRRLF
jgi:hypothetical protein